ncbi:VOC family protein [Sphingomonas sp. 1P06PA]|uniref:VOC family protein n=1 Tax=Sphingomonas sp. 1P06PA TaxID=554121 RepID=UPI0039A4B900
MPQTPPQGYHSVTPYIIVDDPVAALDFYTRAFGAETVMKLTMPDGAIAHAEILIGDSHVMVSGEWPDRGALGPKSLGGSPISLLLYVADVDAQFAQAIAAGATEVSAVADQFYGDRTGTLTDPFGHKWMLATHIEDVSEAEGQQRMDAMMAGGG